MTPVKKCVVKKRDCGGRFTKDTVKIIERGSSMCRSIIVGVLSGVWTLTGAILLIHSGVTFEIGAMFVLWAVSLALLAVSA